MVKGGSPAKSSPPPAMNSPVPRPQAEAVSLSVEPVREPRDELSPVPPITQMPVKNKKPPPFSPENKGDEKKTNQNVILKEADIAPEKARTPAEHPRPGSPMPSPSLTISAIVWYEEPSKRFAMINGLIVTEGSVVEGMRVEEIYPDRVRFLHQNQHLEIFIK
jgi:hypothetical protein